ncbi:hypothetical protein CWC31_02395 [Pseudoalteromonas ruthenica]|uniref:hypothetical protein n=1 Tax=Pseudoalteromonas ruthenica TaxID=151081 RepID=UPI00128A728D|nr:hypothetical protein [Pseudoalteromonas ruthenica]TLX52018.1 hypothetical protein CWC31_02395 [Pseudoalteromonas ruthenica]
MKQLTFEFFEEKVMTEKYIDLTNNVRISLYEIDACLTLLLDEPRGHELEKNKRDAILKRIQRDIKVLYQSAV